MLNVERRPLDITNDDRNRVSEDNPQTWHHSPRAQKAQESALTLVMLPCNYIFQLQIYHWNLLDITKYLEEVSFFPQIFRKILCGQEGSEGWDQFHIQATFSIRSSQHDGAMFLDWESSAVGHCVSCINILLQSLLQEHWAFKNGLLPCKGSSRGHQKIWSLHAEIDSFVLAERSPVPLQVSALFSWGS